MDQYRGRDLRRIARGPAGAALVVLLAGPAVLAFFSGGYFDEPRTWAGLAAWLLVLVGLLTRADGLPRRPEAWLAVGGLGSLAAWTMLSILWAPVAGSAYHAAQIVFLYTGGLLAACLLLRSSSARRAVEPGLAAGVLIVVGYGISERLLPGLLHFHRSVSAEGRLEQPLTYWNAMGELAALGFVLAARIAGDASRAIILRALAAAATAPLGMGLYLSFSRGALFACGAGLVTLVAVAPRWEQLRALVLTIAAGVLASLAAAPFRGVTALAGAHATRERQGAIALGLLVAIMLAVGLAQARLARRERPAVLRLPQHAPLVALLLVCAGVGGAIVVGAKEKSRAPLSGGASRLASLQSSRYNYWGVAMRAFAAEPLRGVGAGGWAVWWLRYRPNNEFAQDAHSLPIQTLAELGIVGLALLAVFLAGIGLSARSAYRAAPAQAAAPIAGVVTYLVHSTLDWDWQMPALTLVAIVLGGMLLALAEGAPLQLRDERRAGPWEDVARARDVTPV